MSEELKKALKARIEKEGLKKISLNTQPRVHMAQPLVILLVFIFAVVAIFNAGNKSVNLNSNNKNITIAQIYSASPGKVIKRPLSELSKVERDLMVAEAFALYPELFSDKRTKYKATNEWLSDKYDISASHTRDLFSAGGQTDIIANGKRFYKAPQIFSNFQDVKPLFMSYLKQHKITLAEWVSSVSRNVKSENQDVFQALIADLNNTSSN